MTAPFRVGLLYIFPPKTSYYSYFRKKMSLFFLLILFLFFTKSASLFPEYSRIEKSNNPLKLKMALKLLLILIIINLFFIIFFLLIVFSSSGTFYFPQEIFCPSGNCTSFTLMLRNNTFLKKESLFSYLCGNKWSRPTSIVFHLEW